MRWSDLASWVRLAQAPRRHLTGPVVNDGLGRTITEHPFHGIKNLFGYKKVSYRGLRKNGVRLYAQFALANLVLAKRALLDQRCQGIGAS